MMDRSVTEELQHPRSWNDPEIKPGTSVHYVCQCGEELLYVYRIEGNYETRAECPKCGYNRVIHDG